MRTPAGRRQRFSMLRVIEPVRSWVSDIMSIGLIIQPIKVLAALCLFHALEGSSHNQLILFDESLHNYFHMGHTELANTLGVAFEGTEDINALMALEKWAKGGCK
jgi:hypothetical protein